MEHSVIDRFRTIVGSGHQGVAGQEHWDRHDVEESLAKLTKGEESLAISLSNVNVAIERLQAGSNGRGNIADLEAHAKRLRKWRADLEPQIELLRRAEKEPDAIAASPDDRKRLRKVLANTPAEMAGVGHAIYLVDVWFFEQQPGDRADRRKEIAAVLDNIKEGSTRRRN